MLELSKAIYDGTFGPQRNITRAEFVTMAIRMVEYVKSNFTGDFGSGFKDVDKNAWYAENIETAKELGLIKGDGTGNFRPDDAITRAEAMTIVNRLMGRAADKDYLLDNMVEWPDNMDTNAWYYADVQETANSHDYTWKEKEEEISNPIEKWEKLLENRDWAALEKEWSTANDGPAAKFYHKYEE